MPRRVLAVGLACALLLSLGITQSAVAQPPGKSPAFLRSYDPGADVLLKGKVIRIEWLASASHVHMDVTEASGISTRAPKRPLGAWVVEIGNSNTLSEIGIMPKSGKKQMDIVVQG